MTRVLPRYTLFPYTTLFRSCGNYSKASPQTTILPVLLQKDNFRFKTHCAVTRVNTDPTGKRATGVTYVDVDGNEIEQPAQDRKSTRLNSSHMSISYAVFCLK